MAIMPQIRWDYSSLLKEKTWVKNYRAGTSMHHEVEYAHALDKVPEINAKDNFNAIPIRSSLGRQRLYSDEDQ